MNFTLNGCITVAKNLTNIYKKNHVGKNELEKECIRKGYIVKRYGEIFSDCLESEKNKMGIFALTFNSYHKKGGFVLVR